MTERIILDFKSNLFTTSTTKAEIGMSIDTYSTFFKIGFVINNIFYFKNLEHIYRYTKKNKSSRFFLLQRRDLMIDSPPQNSYKVFV